MKSTGEHFQINVKAGNKNIAGVKFKKIKKSGPKTIGGGGQCPVYVFSSYLVTLSFTRKKKYGIPNGI